MTVYSAIKRQYLPDDLLSIYTSSQQIATIIIKATLITTIIIATFKIIIILHTSTQTITIIIVCSNHRDYNTGCPKKVTFRTLLKPKNPLALPQHSILVRTKIECCGAKFFLGHDLAALDPALS